MKASLGKTTTREIIVLHILFVYMFGMTFAIRTFTKATNKFHSGVLHTSNNRRKFLEP